MRARPLAVLGTALAVLSLGLPWRFVPGTLSYLTAGYYSTWCDYAGYCYTSYTPGIFIPGLPEGTYPGSDGVLRFYVAAAVVLALWWGLHLGHTRALRWAAYVLLAGAVLSNIDGLSGGLVAVLAASLCLWTAGREVMRTEQTGAPSA
jgi:hypothetical protein